MQTIHITSRTCRFFAGLATGLALTVWFQPVTAADRFWNGGGDGFTMTQAANWGGTAPVANDSLFFGGGTGLTPFNDFTTGTAFAGITFQVGASSFTLTGNELNLAAGVTNLSANLQTISLNLNQTANRSHHAVGDLLYEGAVKNQALLKYGPGTLTLGGSLDNSNLRAEVHDGTLVLAKTVNSVRSLGTSPIVVNGPGTLRVAGPGTDQIHFNQRVVVTNGGVFQIQNSFEEIAILSGSNSFTGVIENGLAATSTRLDLGGGNGQRGIYSGLIRDGAGGVLNLQLYRHNNVQVFNGTHTYTGTTAINNTSGTGVTRLILNGTHTGGGAYTIAGHASITDRHAVLGGAGTISAALVEARLRGWISPGGRLSADAAGATYTDTTATLTFSNNVIVTNGTLDVQLNGTTPGTGYDRVVVAGGGSIVITNGNLQFALGFTPAIGDQFTIVEVEGTDPARTEGAFTSLNGVITDLSQGAVFVDPGSGKNFRISYRAEGTTFDAGGNNIMLEVVAPAGGAELTWRGNGTDNHWDVTTTANWWNGSSLVTFTNGDFVTFDNTGSNNIPVNLVGDLTPATLTINATKDFILGGSGKLTGTVVLTKTNTGTFTLTTDNDFVGAVLVQHGTLKLGTNGTTGSLTSPVTVQAAGTLAYERSDDVSLSTTAFGGAGTVEHRGAGRLTIATNLGAFTGTTKVVAGELVLGDGTGMNGAVGGTVQVGATNTLRYQHNSTGGTTTVGNQLAGTGTVIYDYPGFLFHTYSIPVSAQNSNFSGTMILTNNVRLNVVSDGPGYALGNGGLVDATAPGSKVSLGRTTVPYNQTFRIAGPGWSGEFPTTGALLTWRASISGPIQLLADSAIRVSGGTVWGQITGPYNLELQTDTNGYPNDVLTLNPTNGANSYGDTLVRGFVRAASSGALSPNGLAVDLGARLDVFGTTVTVANLQNGPNGAGWIANSSGSAAGTLVVGTDGSSTTFDGVFGNGGSQPLHLTKVGAGTLTLTAPSTNTGTITVNGGALALSVAGSFANAARLVANGTLDVAGIGGTLTLSAGQTLAGNGTVAGGVNAPVGSIVSPGASVGTLTVTGNINLAGTLLLELNRTNTPSNCDQLVSSGGSITYGGLLVVTNIGPALQVGDTFHLFPTAVSGFSGIALAATDATGNVYTWTNRIGSDGSIQVLSVTPPAPPVDPNPTNLVISVGSGNLTLSWPASHTGWSLQAQTNVLGTGLSTNWVTLGYETTNQVTLPVNPANPAVFYRLRYTLP